MLRPRLKTQQVKPNKHSDTNTALQAGSAHGLFTLRCMCWCPNNRAGSKEGAGSCSHCSMPDLIHTLCTCHRTYGAQHFLFTRRATMGECPACVGALTGATLLLGGRTISSASMAWLRGGWSLGGRGTPPGSPKLPLTPGTNPCCIWVVLVHDAACSSTSAFGWQHLA